MNINATRMINTKTLFTYFTRRINTTKKKNLFTNISIQTLLFETHITLLDGSGIQHNFKTAMLRTKGKGAYEYRARALWIT